jgi:hypothetical protein
MMKRIFLNFGRSKDIYELCADAGLLWKNALCRALFPDLADITHANEGKE